MKPKVHYRVPSYPLNANEPQIRVFHFHLSLLQSRGSSVSIVSDYGLDDRVRLPAGAKDFILASASRSVLGPTQSPFQWVPGVLSPGVKRGWGVTLTTHSHLVPRSRISRSSSSSPTKHLLGVLWDNFTLL
jgi:hypothetical protein